MYTSYDEVVVLSEAYKKLDDIGLKIDNIRRRILLMQSLQASKSTPVVAEAQVRVVPPKDTRSEMNELKRKLMGKAK